MKYLRLFDTHAEYKSFILTEEFIKPNVSYCKLEEEVHYNPYVHNYSKDYLTFKPLEDGTFSFSNSINYSIDNGQTWVNLASNTATPTISAGSKIMWKASGLTPTSAVGIGTFSSTGKFDVEGNAMLLVGGDSFVETTTMSSYQFFRLFRNCVNLVSAKHLILPVTTLASDCYESMFQGCTSLTTAPTLSATTLRSECYDLMFYGCTSLKTAPELPATTLENGCYGGMFSECTSLNYIKALFTTTPNVMYTSNWVYNVATTGTFVKNSAATWTTTGNNGVPSGWTVQTASA